MVRQTEWHVVVNGNPLRRYFLSSTAGLIPLTRADWLHMIKLQTITNLWRYLKEMLYGGRQGDPVQHEEGLFDTGYMMKFAVYWRKCLPWWTQGEHWYLHQSLSLHGLDVCNLAIARQFKAYFPCTRAKPHLHERHNRTLWLVILNPRLTAPCWPWGHGVAHATHNSSAWAVQTCFSVIQ